MNESGGVGVTLLFSPVQMCMLVSRLLGCHGHSLSRKIGPTQLNDNRMIPE